MSSCYKTLDVMGKERYKEKLKPVCFSISNKPYLPSHTKKFCSDISQWPKIKYGHIFAYFVSRPGTYTQEQLLLGSSGNVDNLPVFPGYHQELIWAANAASPLISSWYHPCSMGMIGSYTTQSLHDRLKIIITKLWILMTLETLSRFSLTPTSSKRQ